MRLPRNGSTAPGRLCVRSGRFLSGPLGGILIAPVGAQDEEIGEGQGAHDPGHGCIDRERVVEDAPADAADSGWSRA